MKAKTKAIIYTRFSPRPNADKTTSEEKQLEACKKHCEKQGYEVVKIYSDRIKSGDDLDRQGLWDAIGSLRKGMILVVRWRSRLARDVYLSEVINRTVKKSGAKIEAAEENNGDSPQDELIKGVLALMAQYERKISALRTKYAMLRYQNKDFRIMSKKLPYGFRVDYANKGKMKECLEERDIINVMLDLYDTGMSFRGIAGSLNVQRLRPREAKHWDHKTVAKIIRRIKREV